MVGLVVGTRHDCMGNDVLSGRLKLTCRDEYIGYLVDFNVLDAIHAELRRRDTWQGRFYAV